MKRDIPRRGLIGGAVLLGAGEASMVLNDLTETGGKHRFSNRGRLSVRQTCGRRRSRFPFGSPPHSKNALKVNNLSVDFSAIPASRELPESANPN